MNVGIENEAAHFHFREYINWIFGTVQAAIALYQQVNKFMKTLNIFVRIRPRIRPLVLTVTEGG
jgi:hypothetical protein